MSVDDDLFAPLPVLPPDARQILRELIRKVMTSNVNITGISNEIIKLFKRYGITDEREIADLMQQTIKELSGD